MDSCVRGVHCTGTVRVVLPVEYTKVSVHAYYGVMNTHVQLRYVSIVCTHTVYSRRLRAAPPSEDLTDNKHGGGACAVQCIAVQCARQYSARDSSCGVRWQVRSAAGR